VKYRHNITQDRPIVNATDDTSDTLLCAHMLALPVYTAADNPTANSGRGAVNARRSIMGIWRSMTVLIAVAAMLAVCISPALASAVKPQVSAEAITPWQ
jgi:hypothetical protein